MLYTVTLNNQLFLLMLIEKCGLNNIKVISANTDSITIFDDKYKLNTFNQIKEEWEKISLHTLESTEYKKIIYRDVNNYLAQTLNGTPKYKGAFDTFDDKDSDKFDGWHKDHSMLIVPIALREFYLNNKSIEETIYNHMDIFDFCKAVKGKGDAEFKYRYIENGIVIDKPLQKRVNRYIVSNKGGKLIKILPPLIDEDGNNKRDKLNKYRKENPNQLDIFNILEDVTIELNRESEVEAGFNTTILNIIKDKNIENYDINYKYYINECYKIIKSI